MISAEVVDAGGELMLIAAVGVHAPDRRRLASFGAAEDDLLAVLRGATANGPVAFDPSGERLHLAIVWVQSRDPRAAFGALGLEVAIEVIDIRAVGLMFPRNLRASGALGEQDRAVRRPGGDVRPTTA